MDKYHLILNDMSPGWDRVRAPGWDRVRGGAGSSAACMYLACYALAFASRAQDFYVCLLTASYDTSLYRTSSQSKRSVNSQQTNLNKAKTDRAGAGRRRKHTTRPLEKLLGQGPQGAAVHLNSRHSALALRPTINLSGCRAFFPSSLKLAN